MEEAQRIGAIFLDLDGTLLSMKTRRIPDSAYRALEMARARGCKLIAATGRHRLSIAANRWLREIDFDGYVTLNGQLCYCGDQVIHDAALDRGDVALLVEHLEHAPLTGVFSEKELLYINRDDQKVRERQAKVAAPVEVMDIRRALENDLYQVSIYLEEGDDLPGILHSLAHTTYTRWHPTAMDLLSKSGGKWAGIEKMIGYLGLEAAQTAAFGDADNDICMLRGVGVSVAMGGAPDEVKAAADYVTGDVEEDGLLSGMERLFGRFG